MRPLVNAALTVLAGVLCGGLYAQTDAEALFVGQAGRPVANSTTKAWAAGAAPACEAWFQGGPESDPTGVINMNFPEASDTTYWATALSGLAGSSAEIVGRFPFGRYTGLQIYRGQNLVDHLNGEEIQPDPGEENPYVSGTSNGLYTVHVLFAAKPEHPAPNTLYTGGLTRVSLVYRLYHTTDPSDPAGNRVEPILPVVTLGGKVLESCPVRPFLSDSDATVWMRLDQADWQGTYPTRQQQRWKASSPPLWSIADPYAADYFPNGANYYMYAVLSREFLWPHTSNEVYVVRFKAPTFPDTRSGEPVYADRQVRFWSLCADDPYTTSVTRCLSDDEMNPDTDGFVTIVVSDPGRKPDEAALAHFHAEWLAWGALARPGDVMYDRAFRPWGVDTPLHFYSGLIYRQTTAHPGFKQSFANVSKLPRWAWTAALGPYAPVGRYCSTADFEARGAACGD